MRSAPFLLSLLALAIPALLTAHSGPVDGYSLKTVEGQNVYAEDAALVGHEGSTL